jgi:rubrerythrin
MMTHLYAGLTVLEILGVAIKKEIDAANFYRNLADHVANQIVKNRFLALAKDERIHRALLQTEYKRLTGETRNPPAPKMDFPKDDKFDFDKFHIEEALLFAIKAEREAQKLYSEAAKISNDPRGRRMLDYLVEFERGHERQLKSEIDFYKKSPLWFDETEDLIHVGP